MVALADEQADPQEVDSTAPASAPAEEPVAVPDLATAVPDQASVRSLPSEPEAELPAQVEPEALAVFVQATEAPAETPEIGAEAPPGEPLAPFTPPRPSEGLQGRTMAAAAALASAAVSAAKAVASSPKGKALSGLGGDESSLPLDVRGGDIGGYGYAARLGRESTHSLGGFFASFTGASTGGLVSG
jgi:hypothetical protein